MIWSDVITLDKNVTSKGNYWVDLMRCDQGAFPHLFAILFYSKHACSLTDLLIKNHIHKFDIYNSNLQSSLISFIANAYTKYHLFYAAFLFWLLYHDKWNGINIKSSDMKSFWEGLDWHAAIYIVNYVESPDFTHSVLGVIFCKCMFKLLTVPIF